MDNDAGRDERLRAEMTLIAQRAGITFAEDELAGLALLVAQNRDGLERLRTAIRPDEEPAHTFAKQVGRDRS